MEEKIYEFDRRVTPLAHQRTVILNMAIKTAGYPTRIRCIALVVDLDLQITEKQSHARQEHGEASVAPTPAE